MGSLVGKPGWRGNLYPVKQQPEQKIDVAAAVMVAVGRAMARASRQGNLIDFCA